jgi:Spy/CpxP family protein refolding chaperone
MKMKKMILTLVALLSMTAVMAQNDNKERKAPKEVTPEEVTNRMAQELDLTADQKAKVLKLNTEYKDVLRGPGMGPGHHGGPRPDGQTGATEKQQRPERPQLTDAQKEEMKKNFEKQMEKRKEYDKKMQEVLTVAQYKKYKKHHHGGHHGGPRGPRPADAPQK